MMVKIIIFEGVDCSGKSSLANKLSKKVKNGILIKSNYKPDSSNTSEIKKQYLKILLSINNSIWTQDEYIILDRYHLSQVVYSIMRGHDDLDDPWYNWFESNLCLGKNDACLIWVDEPEHVIISRLNGRGDEHIKEEDVHMLRERYAKAYARSNLPKIKVDSNINIDELKIKIDEAMEHETSR